MRIQLLDGPANASWVDVETPRVGDSLRITDYNNAEYEVIEWPDGTLNATFLNATEREQIAFETER